MWPNATMRLDASTPGGVAFIRSRLVCRIKSTYAHIMALVLWLCGWKENTQDVSMLYFNKRLFSPWKHCWFWSIKIDPEWTAKCTWDLASVDSPYLASLGKRQYNPRKLNMSWIMLELPLVFISRTATALSIIKKTTKDKNDRTGIMNSVFYQI